MVIPRVPFRGGGCIRGGWGVAGTPLLPGVPLWPPPMGPALRRGRVASAWPWGLTCERRALDSVRRRRGGRQTIAGGGGGCSGIRIGTGGLGDTRSSSPMADAVGPRGAARQHRAPDGFVWRCRGGRGAGSALRDAVAAGPVGRGRGSCICLVALLEAGAVKAGAVVGNPPSESGRTGVGCAPTEDRLRCVSVRCVCVCVWVCSGVFRWWAGPFLSLGSAPPTSLGTNGRHSKDHRGGARCLRAPRGHLPPPPRPPPPCDSPSGCCSFTGPWTLTRSSLRMLRRVAAFCWPLRPVLLLVSFPRSRSPVVGVLGLCWMWRDVPFAHQRRPVVGVLGVVLVVAGSFDSPPPYPKQNLTH